MQRIVIVGNPNVGKSVLFNQLTGHYRTVSNYPGTTVEVARGKADIEGTEYEVVDTPGMYTFLSINEDEKVGRRILLEEACSLVIHVVEAKNLERMLPFTLQLMEAGFPMILVLNMMDEAEKLVLWLNVHDLENELAIPVVSTVLTKGKGLEQLKKKIKERARKDVGFTSRCDGNRNSHCPNCSTS